jgi:catechol 2,3-dioxygenase-like lactoylglutathione lyase family enzyme
VVTEKVTATPDSDTRAGYDEDEDSEVATIYLATSPPPGTARPGRVRSVAATMLVTNLDRSIAFYRDVLGFIELASGYPGVLLGSGEARIVLRATTVPEPVDRRLVQLLLEVPDVDAAYRDLRDRGVSFIHRPRPVSQYEQLTLWAAAMHDPDGHGIAIAQWRPSH